MRHQLLAVVACAAGLLLASHTNATVGAGLRHVDADLGTESAAGRTFLPGSTDSDNAIGGFHAVCAVGFGLTGADNQFISWDIQLTELNPFIANFTVTSGIDLGVGEDVPCASWYTGGIGDQTVSALYDPDGPEGPVEAVTLQWDGRSDNGATQPLVVQWNFIDALHVVHGSGRLGTAILDDGLSDLTNLSSAGLGGICARDGALFSGDDDCATRPSANERTTAGIGVAIKGQMDGAVSFLAYVLGSHTTHHNGPVDGAFHTITLSGCGSARVEDAGSGLVSTLTSENTSIGARSSALGLGVTVLPTSDGEPLTADGSNASCRPGARTIVQVETGQEILLTSFEDTAPTEIVSIRWRPGP